MTDKSKRSTLNIGFVGTGYIAKIHAAAAKKLAAVKLAAAVDRQPEGLCTFAAEFDIPYCYSNFEAMLDEGGVDALVIGTPNYLHAPEAVAALRKGVHVMVEKPMAMDASQASQMFAASRESGALLMVAHCWRFDEQVLWLKSQVESGKLGKIIRTKGYGVHTNWGPGGWFTQREYAGGGAMADMGIHALDTARFLLGDPLPLSVYARVGAYYGDYDVDDTGLVIVNWEGGSTSYIESGWWQPYADGPEASTQLYGKCGFGGVFPTRLVLPDPEKQIVEVVESGFLFPSEPHASQSMYDRQMAYFVDCIYSGRTPVPGGLEGWVNMRVVDAIYESARTGQVVQII